MFLGLGVRASVGPDRILAGSQRFLLSEGVDTSGLAFNARKHMDQGHSILYVARNEEPMGMIVLSNRIRPGADIAIDCLRKEGIASMHLLSGDTQPTVKDLSETLGFDSYRAAILPEEKAQYVERLEAIGCKMLMVGVA